MFDVKVVDNSKKKKKQGRILSEEAVKTMGLENFEGTYFFYR